MLLFDLDVQDHRAGLSTSTTPGVSATHVNGPPLARRPGPLPSRSRRAPRHLHPYPLTRRANGRHHDRPRRRASSATFPHPRSRPGHDRRGRCPRRSSRSMCSPTVTLSAGRRDRATRRSPARLRVHRPRHAAASRVSVRWQISPVRPSGSSARTSRNSGSLGVATPLPVRKAVSSASAGERPFRTVTQAVRSRRHGQDHGTDRGHGQFRDHRGTSGGLPYPDDVRGAAAGGLQPPGQFPRRGVQCRVGQRSLVVDDRCAQRMLAHPVTEQRVQIPVRTVSIRTRSRRSSTGTRSGRTTPVAETQVIR
ncbi:hypothetical protein SAMN04489731_102551 [Amycolatopsis regifaucium]|nr:hypothetical protein SAMN04489731_102551 [Amycolatopsis regifaucium]